jgi:hypothetical protein
VIACAVLNETVAIIGIFYGGRDHEQILRDTNEPADLPVHDSHMTRERDAP